MLLFLLLLASAAAQTPAKPKPVHVTARIAVTAAAQALPESTADAAQLAQGAQELADALSHQKGITIIDRGDAADVQIEVTDREEREAQGGFGGRQLTHLADVVIRFHARAGVDQIDLKGTGLGGARAAKDGAEKLVKWIARHPAASGAPRQ